MANDTETLADISAELRDKCATHYCCEEARRKDGEYPDGFDVIDTSELANRIDAAAKRAEAKWEGAACACVSDAVMSGKIAVEHKPAGNSDALRWALSGIRLWFVAAANVLDEDASARVTPKALRKLAKDCDAALAAPAVDCPPSNVAALRDALTPWVSLAEWLIENAGKEALGRGIAEIVPTLRKRIDESKAALATTEGGAA